MLEGINILNQVEIMRVDPSCILPIALLVTLIILGAVFIGTACEGYDIFKGILLLIVSVPLLIAIIVSKPSVPTGRYEYTVTIDESVSFTDLYENYEIVEQNGQLWILRDKKK